MMHVGRVIKEKRKQLGLTQEALAKKSHLSRSSVKKAEQYQWNGGCYVGTVRKLLSALDLHGYFLSEVNPYTTMDVEHYLSDSQHGTRHLSKITGISRKVLRKLTKGSGSEWVCNTRISTINKLRNAMEHL